MPPFENQFVQEETTSAVPPAGGSDTLDQFRMSIGQEGFRNIDTNGSGTLSLDELQTALRQDIYDPEQKTAIGELSKTLENAPPLKTKIGNVEVQYSPEIPSWFNDGENHDAPKPEELTDEDRLERLNKAADEVCKQLRPEMNGYRVFNALQKNQVLIEKMWNDAQALDGDPRERMQNLLNERLQGSGHSVSMHFPSEENSPRVHWMKSIDGYLTVDPKKDGNPVHEKWGAGILGFNYGRSPSGTKELPQ